VKKIVFFGLVLLGPVSLGYAAHVESYDLLSASYTATSETAKRIETSPGSVLACVVVGSASPSGLLKIYDSSAAASNQIANISLTVTGNYDFDVRLSSGLTYTTTSNTAGVTITYKNSR
jgi:hypothetical protein